MLIVDFNKRMFGKTSRFKGVSWDKKLQRWQVNCYHNRKTIYLGTCYTEEEAGNRYNKYIKENKLHKSLNMTIKMQRKRGYIGEITTDERTWYKNVKVTIQTFFEDTCKKAKQIWGNKSKL